MATVLSWEAGAWWVGSGPRARLRASRAPLSLRHRPQTWPLRDSAARPAGPPNLRHEFGPSPLDKPLVTDISAIFGTMPVVRLATTNPLTPWHCESASAQTPEESPKEIPKLFRKGIALLVWLADGSANHNVWMSKQALWGASLRSPFVCWLARHTNTCTLGKLNSTA